MSVVYLMRSSLLLRVAAFLTLFAISLISPAIAQEFRAIISGHVADQSDTAIANAKVTVKSLATNETFNTTTSGSGDYSAPFLKPGSYSVTVEAPGFTTQVRNDIAARIGDKVTVDFTMQVGQVSESVTVTAAPPLLDMESASRGGVIDNLRVTELPLNGRNPINFTNLTPGVIFAGNPQFTRPFDNGDNINFSINGGLLQTNEYLLDGAPDDAITDTAADRTHANENIAYIPTVDALQEFKVVTNFYDSQYGRTGGGIVNITTKSGANDFHGTGYEFMRRYQLDANSIASNAAGRPRYSVDPATGENLGGHKLDQYGTQITGPVIIPKLYNGKDKTFFSFGVENYIESTPSPTLTNVPSAAERGGDFSGIGVNIYDPQSIAVNPVFNPVLPDTASNPQYIRTVFPGNIIPGNRFNPVGAAILNAYPAPNVGNPNSPFNNFIASPNLSQDHFRNWIGRVDQNFGQKERMYFRYGHNRRNQFDNGANGYTGPGQDAQDPLVRINDNAVVDSVTVLSPTAILDLRASYTRFIQAAFRTQVTGFDITTLGFPQSFAMSRVNDQPPRIDVNQYPSWGARNPSQNTTNTLSFQPSLSLVRGKHSLKIGSEIRNFRPNAKGGSFLWGAGDFSFDNTFTQRLPEFSDGTGNGVAALLLGIPTSGQLQYTPALAFNWNYYAGYVQDDFRVTDRLTLNLGLRYDVEMAPVERYNRMNRGFAYDAASPLAGQVADANFNNCPSCAALKGGLLFVNTNGQPRNAFSNDLNNWQPRAGFAFRATSRTVVRGGYGLFYLPQANFGGSAGFASNTPFVSTSGGGINAFIPTGSLSDPFPGGVIPPTGASAGLATFLGQNVIFNNPAHKVPKVHSFSFGVQHQLPGNIVIDTSYVGSRSVGINTNENQAGIARNINVPTIQQLAQAHQDSSYFNAQVANPFAGLLPGTSFNGPNISRRQLLLPYPQFGNVQVGLEPVGKIWYDSLQVNAEKRYSAGLTLVAAYTWSKNLEAISFLNDQDAAPSKVLTSNDRTHRFVLSAVYQLPFGRGRHFGGNIGRGWNQAIGGWEVNVIGTLQSGTPLAFSGNTGNFDLVADPTLSNQSFGQWFNGCEVTLAGVTRQANAGHNDFVPCTDPVWRQRDPATTLRATPFRSPNIRNPWAKQWDISLNKRFIFTESINAEFRFEAFNVFNTPIRVAPNVDPTSTQFGLVTTNQSNFPRQVQLGFKFNF